jgi:hypothetical protein
MVIDSCFEILGPLDNGPSEISGSPGGGTSRLYGSSRGWACGAFRCSGDRVGGISGSPGGGASDISGSAGGEASISISSSLSTNPCSIVEGFQTLRGFTNEGPFEYCRLE